jgi:hypothetical protein
MALVEGEEAPGPVPVPHDDEAEIAQPGIELLVSALELDDARAARMIRRVTRVFGAVRSVGVGAVSVGPARPRQSMGGTHPSGAVR